MASTLRIYRGGVLAHSESPADVGGTVAVPTSGWPAGTHAITVTRQQDNERESSPRAAGSVVVTLPTISQPIAAASATAAGTISATPAATITAPPCRLFAIVGFGNWDGTSATVTVEWVGGTPVGAGAWTKIGESRHSVGHHSAQVWATTCTQSLAGAQARAVSSVSQTRASAAISLVPLVNAAGSVIATTKTMAGASSQAGATASGVLSGSWLLVAASVEETGAMTPLTNTTELAERAVAADVTTAAGINSTGGAGSVSAGWSASSSWGAVLVLEVRPG